MVVVVVGGGGGGGGQGGKYGHSDNRDDVFRQPHEGEADRHGHGGCGGGDGCVGAAVAFAVVCAFVGFGDAVFGMIFAVAGLDVIGFEVMGIEVVGFELFGFDDIGTVLIGFEDFGLEVIDLVLIGLEDMGLEVIGLDDMGLDVGEDTSCRFIGIGKEADLNVSDTNSIIGSILMF